MGSLTLTLAFAPQKIPTSPTNLKNCITNPSRIQLKRLKLIKFQLLSCNCSSSSSPNWVKREKGEEDERGFIVVNFYRFVFVEDPEGEVDKHLAFLQDRDIHGRIYLNEQGINAQFSGPSKEALAYVSWLQKDERFHDILVQISPPIHRHAFPRLKLRYKPSLVQMEGGISHLPLLDSSMRASPLTPAEWRNKLEAANNVDVSSNSNLNLKFILLDVRNGYEWDIGHFRGAQRPDVDCFRSTSFGLSRSEVPISYHNPSRQRGYRKLYTLKGGISHYLECEGAVQWIGNLFVFDSRLSLPPPSTNAPESSSHTMFAKCSICGSQVSELRHRNCANLDCNLLFLYCQIRFD